MRTTLITLSLLFFLFSSSAQIQKNTWLLDIDAGLQRTTLQGNTIKFVQYTMAPSFLYFPTANFGFGGRFVFLGSNTNNSFSSSGFNNSFFDVDLEPRLRFIPYRWTEGKTTLFIEGAGKIGFQSRVIFGSNERETSSRWGWSVGPGLTHFLSSSLAVEWQMSYQSTRFLDNVQTVFDESSNEFGAFSTILFRFYLNEAVEGQKDIHSAIFDKGNWMIGGMANFSYADNVGYNLSCSPRAGIFVANGAVIGLGPDLVFFEGSISDVWSWGLATYMRYYFPVASSIHLFPVVSFRYGRLKNNADTFLSNSIRLRTTRFRIGAGLNTMIRPNVGLEFILAYQRDNTKQVEPEGLPVSPQDNIIFELGFQFFLINANE